MCPEIYFCVHATLQNRYTYGNAFWRTCHTRAPTPRLPRYNKSPVSFKFPPSRSHSLCAAANTNACPATSLSADLVSSKHSLSGSRHERSRREGSGERALRDAVERRRRLHLSASGRCRSSRLREVSCKLRCWTQVLRTIHLRLSQHNSEHVRWNAKRTCRLCTMRSRKHVLQIRALGKVLTSRN